MVLEAVVLVGGQGTRLRPLTVATPKPMLPVAGVPFLAHLVARLRAGGVEHVVLSTSFRAEVFTDAFGDGSRLGLEISYVHEETPLGTGGGIRNAAPALRSGPDDPVLVLNGDVLSGLDVRDVLATHEEHGADVTLHLLKVPDPRAFGLVPTDETGRVQAFLEKPQTPEEVVTDQVNAGCYVFRRALVDEIPEGRPVSVERETFPGLLTAGRHLQGHVDRSYWLDLGTPAAFVQGSADVVRGVAPSPALDGDGREALLLGDAEVAGSATVTGGSTVGPGASVGDGCLVEASVLLDGARLLPGAVVRRSVVGRGAVVGAGTVVDEAVVGDGARVGGGNELRAGVRVWPGVELADGAVRFSSDV